MTDGKWEIIRQLLSEYDIKTAEDIQDELKDLLGYEKTARSDSDNARNIRSKPKRKKDISKNFKALKFQTVL